MATSVDRILTAIICALFFSVCFVVLYAVAEPDLIYHNPESYRYGMPDDIDALPDIYQHWQRQVSIGRYTDVAAAKLLPWFAFRFLGTSIIVGLLLVMTLLLFSSCSRSTKGPVRWTAFLPALAALYLFLNYRNPTGPVIGCLVAAGLFAAYTLLKDRAPVTRILFFIIAAIVTIILTDTFPLMAGFIIAFEVVQGGRKAVWTVVIAGLFLIAGLFGPQQILRPIVAVFHPYGSTQALGIFTAAQLLYGTALFAVVASAAMAFRKRPARFAVRSGVGGATVIITALCLGIFASNQVEKARASANRAYFAENWDGVLTAVGALLRDSVSLIELHMVDRALFHKGLMLERLFTIPQHEAGLLLFDRAMLGKSGPYKRWVWSGGTLLELGMVNNAENVTYEALTALSHFPHGLKLLGLVHAVKGMPQAAALCFSAMAKDRWYRAQARSYLKALSGDSLLSGDQSVNTARRNQVVEDGIGGFAFEGLLARNPANRMAFEYLVADKLIRNDVAGCVAAAKYLPAQEYAALPRLYEEALLLAGAVFRMPVDLHGFTISPETNHRFRQFSDLLQRYNDDRAAAHDELEKQFGDSYFFHNVYGSPERRAEE